MKTALYTTIYPGEEPYLKPWYDSVKSQTDDKFDIVIGLDAFSPEQVYEAAGEKFNAVFVSASPGDSPAKVRERAFEIIVRDYDQVIFTDSDDVLHPERVKRTKELLESCDVCACALRIIDNDGTDMNRIFPMIENPDLGKLLPKANIFGLSNTAYRTEFLKKTMPFPAECVMLDWFMVTRCWLEGARITTDTSALMDYRQHSTNTARVLPPFSGPQILKACELLKLHYRLVENHIIPGHPEVEESYRHAADELDLFISAMASEEKLEQYINQLNKLEENHIWWSWIAHPGLEEIWKS